MPVPSPLHGLAEPKARFTLRLPGRPAAVWLGLAALVVGLLAGWWKASPSCLDRGLPRHARYGFVLDGQSPDGYRVAAGLDLLRRKVVDTLIVSGVEAGGGVYNSMLWVRMLPLQASEKGRIVELRSGCTSTMDEARMMDAFFRERKIDTAVVVTSAFHTWRAASIFEKVSAGPGRWYFQGAPDSKWDGAWNDREARKAWTMEWAKRLSWVLLEQWKPMDRSLPIKPHAVFSGEDLGRLPAPAWKP